MIMHLEKRNKRLIVFHEFGDAGSIQRGRFGAGKDKFKCKFFRLTIAWLEKVQSAFPRHCKGTLQFKGIMCFLRAPLHHDGMQMV